MFVIILIVENSNKFVVIVRLGLYWTTVFLFSYEIFSQIRYIIKIYNIV